MTSSDPTSHRDELIGRASEVRVSIRSLPVFVHLRKTTVLYIPKIKLPIYYRLHRLKTATRFTKHLPAMTHLPHTKKEIKKMKEKQNYPKQRSRAATALTVLLNLPNKSLINNYAQAPSVEAFYVSLDRVRGDRT